MSFEQQADFVDQVWTILKDDPSKHFFNLPGKRSTSPSNNLECIEKRPLTGFDALPGGEAFLDLWRTAPHTLVRMGKTGLLAVLEHKKTSRDLVIPLAPNRLLRPIEIGNTPLTLDRDSLADAYADAGEVGHDLQVSRTRHLNIGTSGDRVIFQDLDSSNGTRLAIEQWPHDYDELADPDVRTPLNEIEEVFNEIMRGAGFDSGFDYPDGPQQ